MYFFVIHSEIGIDLHIFLSGKMKNSVHNNHALIIIYIPAHKYINIYVINVNSQYETV